MLVKLEGDLWRGCFSAATTRLPSTATRIISAPAVLLIQYISTSMADPSICGSSDSVLICKREANRHEGCQPEAAQPPVQKQVTSLQKLAHT